MSLSDPERLVLDHDDIYPRDTLHRYRLYIVNGDEREVLAAAPTMCAVGLAIKTIHEDMKAVGRRLADLGRVGIYDTLLRDWILLPWDRKGATHELVSREG